MESIIIKLTKEAKLIYNQYQKEIEDIIIFGSYMKSKENYNDIDVLIIFKTKINKKIEVKLKEKFNLKKIDLNSTTLKDLDENNFIAQEGIYLEGKSLITEKSVSEKWGFKSIAFINYDLKKIKGSNRTRFYYALQGRNDQEGYLEKVGAKRYSENVLICDYTIVEKIKTFLDYWKIDYKITPTLIPKRLFKVMLNQNI
jgi:predicted nucleotidyltransferase